MPDRPIERVFPLTKISQEYLKQQFAQPLVASVLNTPPADHEHEVRFFGGDDVEEAEFICLGVTDGHPCIWKTPIGNVPLETVERACELAREHLRQNGGSPPGEPKAKHPRRRAVRIEPGFSVGPSTK